MLQNFIVPGSLYQRLAILDMHNGASIVVISFETLQNEFLGSSIRERRTRSPGFQKSQAFLRNTGPRKLPIPFYTLLYARIPPNIAAHCDTKSGDGIA